MQTWIFKTVSGYKYLFWLRTNHQCEIYFCVAIKKQYYGGYTLSSLKYERVLVMDYTGSLWIGTGLNLTEIFIIYLHFAGRQCWIVVIPLVLVLFGVLFLFVYSCGVIHVKENSISNVVRWIIQVIGNYIQDTLLHILWSLSWDLKWLYYNLRVWG